MTVAQSENRFQFDEFAIDYKGMQPLWEVWDSYQSIPIPQQRAMWGSPSTVTKLEQPTMAEVLAELAKIQKDKDKQQP